MLPLFTLLAEVKCFFSRQTVVKSDGVLLPPAQLSAVVNLAAGAISVLRKNTDCGPACAVEDMCGAATLPSASRKVTGLISKPGRALCRHWSVLALLISCDSCLPQCLKVAESFSIILFQPSCVVTSSHASIVCRHLSLAANAALESASCFSSD